MAVLKESSVTRSTQLPQERRVKKKEKKNKSWLLMASSLLIHIRSSRPIQVLHCLLQCFITLGVQLRQLSARLLCRLTCSSRCLRLAVLRACRLLAASVDPFWALLFYFVSNSIMGFLLLRVLEPRRGTPPLRDLDLFFTSVSAATVSSMSTVEMEALSRGQLAVVAILMLAGCEVFTSMLHLHLMKAKLLRGAAGGGDALSSAIGTHMGINKDGNYEIELRQMTASPDIEAAHDEPVVDATDSDSWELKYKSINLLVVVVMWYNALLILLGSAAIFLYFAFISGSARDILRKKGIHVLDFSVFLSVSSFANCGFVPTNENMLPFRKNSCLLLLITPLLLAGNTLFPVCLRLLLRILRGVFTERAKLFDYVLSHSNGRQLGFHHLFSESRCIHLLLTAIAFLGVQFILFCSMEWNSDAMGGDMSAYEKAVAVLFQSVNSRHAGESVFDLSKLSPAILVLYVVMMYVPAYTTFSPAPGDEVSIPDAQRSGRRNKRAGLLPKSLILSQLSYIAIFTILVCITERRKLTEDPLNFNALSIVVEVVSAHGNVGFSTGYSCGRRLKPVDGGCKDEWYGFAGWWSNSGKLILITVMFFGRLKMFNKRGGRAWKLT